MLPRGQPGRPRIGLHERLVDEARGGSAEKRAGQLREALALWRGPPLAGLEYEPFAPVEIRRLD